MMTIALFIECALLPVSILNFILLVLMVTVVIKYLKHQTQLAMYEHMEKVMRLVKWVSTIFIFLKYMF